MFIKAASLVLLLEAIVLQVNAVPLRVLGPTEGSPNAKDRVKTATADAHDLVLKMEGVHAAAHYGDRGAMAKVQGAFGVTPDMNGIGHGIQALKHGKFKMDEAQHPTMLGAGAYNPHTDRVSLGSGFHYGTSSKERAGHILHESSHAVLGTKDVINGYGEPTDQQRATYRGDRTGYRDSDLPEMKHNPAFSQNLHHNADSWRVFGDLCRRELERRAYEETDLVKRDEILESRATACAMRPPAKGKGAKGAKGAAKGTAAKGTAAKGTAAKGTAAKGTAAKGTAAKGTAAKGTAAKGTKGAAKATKGVAKGVKAAPKGTKGPAALGVKAKGSSNKALPASRATTKAPARGSSKKLPTAAAKRPAVLGGGAKKPAPVRGGAKKPVPARGASKPAARPGAKPAARPGSKPAARPAVKPAVKPAARPGAKPAGRPAAKPAAKPVVKPAAKPVAKPAAKPAARSAPKKKL